jgi:hypothetical protein
MSSIDNMRLYRFLTGFEMSLEVARANRMRTLSRSSQEMVPGAGIEPARL